MLNIGKTLSKEIVLPNDWELSDFFYGKSEKNRSGNLIRLTIFHHLPSVLFEERVKWSQN